jgi:hypothetical protein
MKPFVGLANFALVGAVTPQLGVVPIFNKIMSNTSNICCGETFAASFGPFGSFAHGV